MYYELRNKEIEFWPECPQNCPSLHIETRAMTVDDKIYILGHGCSHAELCRGIFDQLRKEADDELSKDEDIRP